MPRRKSLPYVPDYLTKLSPESVNDIASDVADIGLADVRLPPPQLASVPMSRPQTSKGHGQNSEQSTQPENLNDALSSVQLRRLVNDFPKPETISYAFNYQDTASFEDEINEWFDYNDAEYKRLLLAKETFERRWKKFAKKSWLESDSSEHAKFIEKEAVGLLASDIRRRNKSLQTILHAILGVWDLTAQTDLTGGSAKTRVKASQENIMHINRGITLLTMAGGIPKLYDTLKNTLEKLGNDEFCHHNSQGTDFPFLQDEIENITTIFYVIIEGVRTSPTELDAARENLNQIAPDMISYFLKIISSFRWNESNEWPQTKLILLFWKSILFSFGGTAEANAVKRALSENPTTDGERVITASPLDYHIFRQEIISKYPAYIPPQPLLPLESDNYSILPPLSNRSRRTNGSNSFIPTALNNINSGASILHQPVHIATPAPSPPPSPPAGGKAGKKQNYQTNQNFPFMYPPLDTTSSSAGGKGLAGLQERLVGRKWEGSDIPKSILEAGDLFAQRMRLTRAMHQLWDEREKYIKFERGWDTDDIDEFDLDSFPMSNDSIPDIKPAKSGFDYEPDSKASDEIKQKLELIESFYKDSLPHLQSLVIVLLKAILANVTLILTQSSSQYQNFAANFKDVNMRVYSSQFPSNPQEPSSMPLPSHESHEVLIEDLEALRSREITTKAVSGILLLLLKWFKVSHILKFEYMTQLLLDSNYLPLILKYFAHQDVEKFVNSRNDDDEMSFFAFCNANSVNAPPEEVISKFNIQEDIEDEAIPPPIKKQRSPNASIPMQRIISPHPYEDGPFGNRRQTADLNEAGCSSTDIQPEIVTDFSWRALFSSINLIRIMQKICKNKTHRNLLLVQYKSSNVLKRVLRVPQSDLRIYNLKLLKNQVPYSGRKWRQGNMRIITAIYLHCRPELRDDWLAGCDVVADVEDALPLEQALRALTHWHNVKRYPNQMGTNTKILADEYDFFARELEKMEIVDETTSELEDRPENGWECYGNGGWLVI